MRFLLLSFPLKSKTASFYVKSVIHIIESLDPYREMIYNKFNLGE